MISVTKLLFAREYYGDNLRYTKNAHTMRNGAAEGMGPVVHENLQSQVHALLYAVGCAEVQR